MLFVLLVVSVFLKILKYFEVMLDIFVEYNTVEHNRIVEYKL